MSEAQTVKGKTEYVKVNMTDSRVVDFPGKRRMLKDKIVEADKVGVRFDFRNGETRTFYVPSHLLTEAAAHGYAQKLGDTVAGMKNEDGSPVSEDDMLLEVEGLHERLAADGSNWNEVSEGGGFGGASVLMKALIEHTGMEPEKVKEFLKAKSAGEKLALRENATRKGKTGLTIKEIVTRLEAEKKAKAVQIPEDKLFEGLPA